jgi:hypothetical protein
MMCMSGRAAAKCSTSHWFIPLLMARTACATSWLVGRVLVAAMGAAGCPCWPRGCRHAMAVTRSAALADGIARTLATGVNGGAGSSCDGCVKGGESQCMRVKECVRVVLRLVRAP